MAKTPRVSIFRSFRSQFPGKLRYPPNIERPVLVQNEYFSVISTWRRRDGIWICTKAPHPVSWMVGLDPISAKRELARMGCSWHWQPISDSASKTAVNDKPVADLNPQSVGTRYATPPGANSLDPLSKVSAIAAS